MELLGVGGMIGFTLKNREKKPDSNDVRPKHIIRRVKHKYAPASGSKCGKTISESRVGLAMPKVMIKIIFCYEVIVE